MNGTLDSELIQQTFGDTYQDKLRSSPDLFYKTACVYIDQEIKYTPKWPDTKQLGKFICQLYQSDNKDATFEKSATLFDNQEKDYSADFKDFVKWFVLATTVPGISYSKYIDDGASFAEQCFAIWANVVNIEHNRVTNNEHAIERVEQYIKSYYISGYKDDLEEWECELHMA